jgi:PKD repeat protein
MPEETITFDASASYDPDGWIVQYTWDFGNGTILNITEPKIGHIYATQGEYNVTLYCFTDGYVSEITSKMITVLPINISTIEVIVNVGSIHFRGEIAESNMLTTNYGEVVDVTKIEAHLYYNNSFYANLTSLVHRIDTGFYTITFNIPTDAETGKYTLLVKAEYYNAKGTSMASFLISSSLTGWNYSIAKIVEINNEVATIATDLNSIKVNLTLINATLRDIEGKVATVDSKIGALQTTLETINGTLAGLIVNNKNELLAAVDTTLGSLTTRLDASDGTISEIRGNTNNLHNFR